MVGLGMRASVAAGAVAVATLAGSLTGIRLEPDLTSHILLKHHSDPASWLHGLDATGHRRDPTDRWRDDRQRHHDRRRDGHPGSRWRANPEPCGAGRPDRTRPRPSRTTSPPPTPGIAAAATKLDRLALEANTLLQQYAVARDAERTAREESNRNVLLYQQLSTRLGEDRRALGQWAYLAYAGTGGSISDMGTLLDTLAKPAAEASDTAAQLSYLSDQRSWQIQRVQNQTQLQRTIALKAVEASTRATEAATQAADAKAKLDVVITEQKAQLDATRQLHAEQVAKAGPVAGLLLGSGDAGALEASKRLRAALVVPGVLADGSVKACSTNEGEYPNGKIPVAGLCPLVGAPGESLRPGAAAAFNAMSIAYQKDTGSTICVTDSYRSYAEQVSVKAEKGKWAATPGKSEHGMGRAVDLCGGINSFGTPAHLWMKQNAPLYGWFHPDWAEPTGSLPEPWHWEYAG